MTRVFTESSNRQVCALVVEDDPALRRMILNYFEENNIRTLSASGHQETVRQVGSAEVNLVILDLRLGQENGPDLLRHIRSTSDVPVTVVSGHRRDDIDRVIGLELGADDYLTKRSISANLPCACPSRSATVRCRTRRIDTQHRARAVWFFRVEARSQDPSPDRPDRRPGGTDQGRVCAAHRRPRCATAAAQPRAPAAGDARSRGCVRSQHRPADPAPQARTRSERAARHRVIRTERGIGYVLAVPVERV